MSDDPFPGSAADFYERIQVYKAEFQKAKEWNQLCELEMKNLKSIIEGQDEDIERFKSEIVRLHNVIEDRGIEESR